MPRTACSHAAGARTTGRAIQHRPAPAPAAPEDEPTHAGVGVLGDREVGVEAELLRHVPIRSRVRRRNALGRSPRTSTVPSVGPSEPVTMRIVVVFPEPDGPITPTTEPAGMTMSRASTATVPGEPARHARHANGDLGSMAASPGWAAGSVAGRPGRQRRARTITAAALRHTRRRWDAGWRRSCWRSSGSGPSCPVSAWPGDHGRRLRRSSWTWPTGRSSGRRPGSSTATSSSPSW